MKYRIIISLIIFLIIFSCDKEKKDPENETTGEGTFEYKNETLPAPNFDLVLYDEYHDDDYMGCDLVFYSNEMTYYIEDNWHYGNGNAVRIDVISPDPDGLVSGTYEYDHTNAYLSHALPNSIYWGNVTISSKKIDHEIIDGHADITVNDHEYTISYSVVLENKDTITGEYTGKANNYSHN